MDRRASASQLLGRLDCRPDALCLADFLHFGDLTRLESAHRSHVLSLQLQRRALSGRETGLAAPPAIAVQRDRFRLDDEVGGDPAERACKPAKGSANCRELPGKGGTAPGHLSPRMRM